MKYVQAKWKHKCSDEPVLFYSELDDDHWEHRKLEVYRDGRQGFADAAEEHGGTRLGIEPWPSLEEIASDPQFEVAEISGDQFEKLWARRHLRADP